MLTLSPLSLPVWVSVFALTGTLLATAHVYVARVRRRAGTAPPGGGDPASTRAARTAAETAFAFAWAVYLYALLKQGGADIAMPLSLGFLLVRIVCVKDVPRP